MTKRTTLMIPKVQAMALLVWMCEHPLLVWTTFGTFEPLSYLKHGEGMAGVCMDLTIEVTLDTVQVQHPGVARGSLVDTEEPLHVAVTQPGVAAQ